MAHVPPLLTKIPFQIKEIPLDPILQTVAQAAAAAMGHSLTNDGFKHIWYTLTS